MRRQLLHLLWAPALGPSGPPSRCSSAGWRARAASATWIGSFLFLAYQSEPHPFLIVALLLLQTRRIATTRLSPAPAAPPRRRRGAGLHHTARPQNVSLWSGRIYAPRMCLYGPVQAAEQAA